MPIESGGVPPAPPASVFGSMPPGCAAILPRPSASSEVEAIRHAAVREGWCWVAEDGGPVDPGARSVVIAGTHRTPEALAGDILTLARRGVRSLLVLGPPTRRTQPSRHPLLAREARRRYGGAARSPEAALHAALLRWRDGDADGARSTVHEFAGDDLLADGVGVARDLVVLESMLARECGSWFDAEALARAAMLAAMLASADASSGASARLALARVLIERGRIVPALGALEGLGARDPAVCVIAHVVEVRLAIACGALTRAGRHIEALAGLAGRSPWAMVHLWDARARLRSAVRDWPGARDACARGEEVALRYGWRRRVAKFAAQRDAARAPRAGETFVERTGRWIVVDDLVAVLETCQEQADEVTAIVRVGARVMARLGASGVAVVAAGDGAPAVLGSCGAIAGMPPWLDEIMATGVRRPPEAVGPASCGAPIRAGGRVTGALLCQWAPGALVPAAEAAALVETAATALAPVVRSLVERRMQIDAGNAMLGDLVGGSAAMQAVRAAVLRAAHSPFPVLVEGESGSGKELVARAVHRLSVRRAQRFVALNCAAMADELVEAELFGHARGAFTGAVGERAGLFEEASQGTLFLDEVAELSPRAQAKLLRVLQEGEVRRVGENRARRIDVRVVAASNRALASEVRAGRFRADLLYRLDVVRISIPPLRGRLEDLPVLAVHLWRDVAARAGCRAALGAAVLDALGRYDWPGNVRELQNVLASLAVSAPRRGVVPVSALPSHLFEGDAARPRPLSLDRARREFDARYVTAALLRAGGRQAVAARELGLSRQGLAKLMARLRLSAGAPREDAGVV